jgi:hypothetical protein
VQKKSVGTSHRHEKNVQKNTSPGQAIADCLDFKIRNLWNYFILKNALEKLRISKLISV